jgi:hypothetical protein
MARHQPSVVLEPPCISEEPKQIIAASSRMSWSEHARRGKESRDLLPKLTRGRNKSNRSGVPLRLPVAPPHTKVSGHTVQRRARASNGHKVAPAAQKSPSSTKAIVRKARRARVSGDGISFSQLQAC